jgi:DMSO/TMAO reductase YedYZ molybdopterin-dependent catalytic subunit
MNRRTWISGVLASAGALVASGCGRIADSQVAKSVLHAGEALSMGAQRLLIGRHALAREFTDADISPDFRANGSTNPQDAPYRALADTNFADYRLVVDGLVDNPLSLSLDELRAAPSRTQVTRHDCVEGWSSIGKWTGARLASILEAAGLQGDARFIVFHCLDTYGSGPDNQYYESIDLVDALHEQTILAYDMNDQALPIAHGAPLRLRVERHLGYKHAKYIGRIEAVASLDRLHGGNGGYWEDRGYEWYAGI